jgi:hypothetical protein
VGDDHEPRAFDVFGPKAIAAIGNLPPTIADRCIAIRLERRAGEQVEQLRAGRIRGDLEQLRRQLRRFADDHATALRDADPAIPAGIHDRLADGWRPLLAIADAVGGDWPERAGSAAKALAGAVDPDADDTRTLLLRDLRSIFAEARAKWLPTKAILERLSKMPERPWSEWRNGREMTSNALGTMLRPYGVRSTKERVDMGKEAHGYAAAMLRPVWDRYLGSPDTPDEASQASQASQTEHFQGVDKAQVATDETDATLSRGILGAWTEALDV